MLRQRNERKEGRKGERREGVIGMNLGRRDIEVHCASIKARGGNWPIADARREKVEQAYSPTAKLARDSGRCSINWRSHRGRGRGRGQFPRDPIIFFFFSLQSEQRPGRNLKREERERASETKMEQCRPKPIPSLHTRAGTRDGGGEGGGGGRSRGAGRLMENKCFLGERNECSFLFTSHSSLSLFFFSSFSPIHFSLPPYPFLPSSSSSSSSAIPSCVGDKFSAHLWSHSSLFLSFPLPFLIRVLYIISLASYFHTYPSVTSS